MQKIIQSLSQKCIKELVKQDFVLYPNNTNAPSYIDFTKRIIYSNEKSLYHELGHFVFKYMIGYKELFNQYCQNISNYTTAYRLYKPERLSHEVFAELFDLKLNNPLKYKAFGVLYPELNNCFEVLLDIYYI